MSAEFQTSVMRELDRIHDTIQKQSEKIDALTENVTSLKVKSGMIASVVGFISGILAVLFGK